LDCPSTAWYLERWLIFFLPSGYLYSETACSCSLPVSPPGFFFPFCKPFHPLEAWRDQRSIFSDAFLRSSFSRTYSSILFPHSLSGFSFVAIPSAFFPSSSSPSPFQHPNDPPVGVEVRFERHAMFGTFSFELGSDSSFWQLAAHLASHFDPSSEWD